MDFKSNKKKRNNEEYIFEENDSEIEAQDTEETYQKSDVDMENNPDVLFQWRGFEYENYGISRRMFLILTFALCGIILYALISNNPIMAITFILIGVAGYLHYQKEARELDFTIISDGIVIGNEIYAFDNIKSFWIHYNPPHTKIVSLHIKGTILPYVHIPIHDEDPVKIRAVLLEFIPEEKQEPTLIDALERFIHKK
jgi:hypothetical protein